jgi:hypothetical protein
MQVLQKARNLEHEICYSSLKGEICVAQSCGSQLLS